MGSELRSGTGSGMGCGMGSVKEWVGKRDGTWCGMHQNLPLLHLHI